jgi:hypothetical protein
MLKVLRVWGTRAQTLFSLRPLPRPVGPEAALGNFWAGLESGSGS